MFLYRARFGLGIFKGRANRSGGQLAEVYKSSECWFASTKHFAVVSLSSNSLRRMIAASGARALCRTWKGFKRQAQ